MTVKRRGIYIFVSVMGNLEMIFHTLIIQQFLKYFKLIRTNFDILFWRGL